MLLAYTIRLIYEILPHLYVIQNIVRFCAASVANKDIQVVTLLCKVSIKPQLMCSQQLCQIVLAITQREDSRQTKHLNETCFMMRAAMQTHTILFKNKADAFHSTEPIRIGFICFFYLCSNVYLAKRGKNMLFLRSYFSLVFFCKSVELPLSSKHFWPVNTFKSGYSTTLDNGRRKMCFGRHLGKMLKMLHNFLLLLYVSLSVSGTYGARLFVWSTTQQIWAISHSQ